MVMGYLRLTWLLVILAVTACPQQVVGSIAISGNRLMIIHVDGDGRYWWHIGRVSEGNLPRLVTNVSVGDEETSYFPDYSSLRTILYDHGFGTRPNYLVVQVHPGAHHTHFGNLCALLISLHEDDKAMNASVDQEVEAIKDSLRGVYADYRRYREECTRLNKRWTELRLVPRFQLRHCVTEWKGRNDRIMKFAWQGVGVAPAVNRDPTSDMSFATYWEAGEWGDLLAPYADPGCSFSPPPVQIYPPKRSIEPSGVDE